ncbi:hypothetical protein [Chromobacterium violaceum]|uniref:hypothetical protein n=1 Tax=Chromobacterium violaceum TaxID=536 RepID=UPI001CE08455|nr:hypothetical protein [Chromobacterium violaceum]
MYKSNHPFNFFLACSFTLLSACSGGGSGSNHSVSQSESVSPNHPSTATTEATGTYTPAGNISTVIGVDSEHRGYRDDVKQLIIDLKPSSPELKYSAEELAKTYQNVLNSSALQNTTSSDYQIFSEAQAARCAIKNTKSDNIAELTRINGYIYSRTYNTEERISVRQAMLNAPGTIAILNDNDLTNCQPLKEKNEHF